MICKWCNDRIWFFQKKIDGMHLRCKQRRDRYLEQEELYRCWKGHSFTFKRKDAPDRCPDCGEQLNPASSYESTRACINVMSMPSVEAAAAADGQEIEVELERGKPRRYVMKQIPYLPDAVILQPKGSGSHDPKKH